jgi:hypothetical protein
MTCWSLNMIYLLEALLHLEIIFAKAESKFTSIGAFIQIHK